MGLPHTHNSSEYHLVQTSRKKTACATDHYVPGKDKDDSGLDLYSFILAVHSPAPPSNENYVMISIIKYVNMSLNYNILFTITTVVCPKQGKPRK